jgi:hypothetical protein
MKKYIFLVLLVSAGSFLTAQQRITSSWFVMAKAQRKGCLECNDSNGLNRIDNNLLSTLQESNLDGVYEQASDFVYLVIADNTQADRQNTVLGLDILEKKLGNVHMFMTCAERIIRDRAGDQPHVVARLFDGFTALLEQDDKTVYRYLGSINQHIKANYFVGNRFGREYVEMSMIAFLNHYSVLIDGNRITYDYKGSQHVADIMGMVDFSIYH